MFVVDISNYNDFLTHERVQEWIDYAARSGLGDLRVIVRAGLESERHRYLTRQQLGSLREMDVRRDIYSWFYLSENPESFAQQIMDLCSDYNPEIYHLDLEERVDVGSPYANQDWCTRYFDTLISAGRIVSVYTSEGWWREYMANTEMFSMYYLWLARWDDISNVEVWHSFGGWSFLLGKQYTEEGDIGGVLYDFSVYDDEVVSHLFDEGPPATCPPSDSEPAPPPVQESPALLYNPDYAGRQQSQDWTCAINACWGLLQSIGWDVSILTLVDLMNPRYVTTQDGLRDASGAGLAQFLREEYGLPAGNHRHCTWQDVYDRAGQQPVAIGGEGWYHWVAVRRPNASEGLDLMNSANGYAGPKAWWPKMYQEMDSADFKRLGPFSMVFIDVGGGEDMARIQELEQEVAALDGRLGYLKGDVASDMERALADLELALSTGNEAAILSAIEHGLHPAIATLKRGGV